MTDDDKEFLTFVVQERMLQHYQSSGGLKTAEEREVSDELERGFDEAMKLLPPEQAQTVLDYLNDLFDHSGREQEFYYLCGLKDGLRLPSLLYDLCSK